MKKAWKCSMESRPVYGTAEIAETLGVSRYTVAQWKSRQSFSLPPPLYQLRMGPVWAADIELWIARHVERRFPQSHLSFRGYDHRQEAEHRARSAITIAFQNDLPPFLMALAGYAARLDECSLGRSEWKEGILGTYENDAELARKLPRMWKQIEPIAWDSEAS